ncbi:MAG: hypothetical protein C7B46_08300 [Sulfobacillus benefaciens]|uniref:Uncharacterized protein n=1 Tax=Sulfobacillus benefaciens TaxID=453960 RepID=A0A2T2XH82_9FIRM|nr:MAG: hypothetical protein C7B46_08300 [Sulfobacillus benefaciens]
MQINQRTNRSPAHRWRRVPALAITVGIMAAVAGCGTLSGTSRIGPMIPTNPPSTRVLQHLLPKGQIIAKSATLKFKSHAPIEIVVSTTKPTSSTSVVGQLQVSEVNWNSPAQKWKVIWQSPKLDLQQSLLPGKPVMGPVSSWQLHQTPRGALVGILNPASLGASTIWNQGLILWVPPAKLPRLLWMATGNHMLANGILKPSHNGFVVKEDACGVTEAVSTIKGPQIKTLSCTATLANIKGQRIAFIVKNQGPVQLARTTLSLAQGSTLIFWPANAEAAQQVNNGSLGLYGGGFGPSGLPNGQVPLAQVDFLTQWSYQFTTPGTYQFAIVSNSVPVASVPPMITVTVPAP